MFNWTTQVSSSVIGFDPQKILVKKFRQDQFSSFFTIGYVGKKGIYNVILMHYLIKLAKSDSCIICENFFGQNWSLNYFCKSFHIKKQCYIHAIWTTLLKCKTILIFQIYSCNFCQTDEKIQITTLGSWK